MPSLVVQLICLGKNHTHMAVNLKGAFRLRILQSPKDFATDGPKGCAYLL